MIKRTKILRELGATPWQIVKYYWRGFVNSLDPNRSVCKNMTIRNGSITPNNKNALIKNCTFIFE
jgi:hypothetical protein